jgi:propionyl-CoA carboxylase alpha chain
MPPERAQYRHGQDTVSVSYARLRDGRFVVTITGTGLDSDDSPGPAVDGPVTGDGTVPEGTPESGEPVTIHHVGGGWIEFGASGRRHRLHVLAAGDQVWVQGPDGDVRFTAVPRFPEAGSEETVAGALVAPMPGTVLGVHVAAGDTVAAGQLLMIVEAMKMEHRITAPRAGTVTEVRARPGDQVNGGDLLAVLDE